MQGGRTTQQSAAATFAAKASPLPEERHLAPCGGTERATAANTPGRPSTRRKIIEAGKNLRLCVLFVCVVVCFFCFKPPLLRVNVNEGPVGQTWAVEGYHPHVVVTLWSWRQWRALRATTTDGLVVPRDGALRTCELAW